MPRAYEWRLFVSATEDNTACLAQVKEQLSLHSGNPAVSEPSRLDHYLVLDELVGVKVAQRNGKLSHEVKVFRDACDSTGAERWAKSTSTEIQLTDNPVLQLKKERIKYSLKTSHPGLKQAEMTTVAVVDHPTCLRPPQELRNWVTICIEGDDTDAIHGFVIAVGIDRLFPVALAKAKARATLSDVAVSYPRFVMMIAAESTGPEDTRGAKPCCSMSCEPLCALLPWNKDCKVAWKIAPKVFMSNERTLMSWFRTSVTLGTAGAAVVGFSGGSAGEQGHGKNFIGIVLCGLGIFFAMYSLAKFYQRAGKIRLALEGPYEDFHGPALLAGSVILGLGGLATWNLYTL